MKIIITILFTLFIHFNLSGQEYSSFKKHELSYKDSVNLVSLGLEINNNKYNTLQLRNLLFIEKRRKVNNIIGSIFRIGGYINGGIGVLILATVPSQDSGLGQGLAVLIGSSFVSVGAIGYGISVPFKGASKRRAFEKELLIQKLREKE